MLNKHILSAAVTVAALGVTSASAFALDIPLANGSFDTGSPGSNTFGLVSNWTFNTLVPAANQVGVFTSYAGFVPSNGPRMALLSNQGVGTVQLRQITPIALQKMSYLAFNYMYLTTDSTATSDASRDRFSVIVDYFAADGVTQIGTESFTNLGGGPLVSTGVNPGAPFGSTVSATNQGLAAGALRGASITLNPLFNSAPFANFTFYLENQGVGGTGSVGIGSSGVLLDGIVINPEPGTFALFGLGAAALGGMAMRRRKAAKAKKAS